MSESELPTTVAEEDRATLAAIARQDAGALGRLYDRHGGTVFALCLRILKERTAAEETLEDVFWELWRKADRFDPARGNAVAYLMNLTQSRAVDRLRAKVRRQRLHPAHDVGGLAEGSHARPVDEQTPLRDCLQTERRERIQTALKRLSIDQRAVVELAYFDGLTHVEIAAKLAQPLGTVKTRIRAGLVHLREALRSEFGESDPGRAPRPGGPTRPTDFRPEGQADPA